MPHVAQEQKPESPVPLAALFIAFLTVSLCGFGGGLALARRIAVEQRRLMTEQEFADIVRICQFMPGPNIVGIAVCVGAKLRGGIGAIAALCGFIVIPWGIGFTIGALFLEYAHLTVIRNILGGVSATAAGLLIATGIRLLLPYRGHPAAVLFATLAFVLMAFSRLPLLVVLLGLVPLSIAVAAIGNARTR
jgi:chromate transporter